MPRKSYEHHNITCHNGTGWLEGEPPFDMTDEKKLLSVFCKVVKGYKRKLVCEKCGEVKKSAVGFLSHLEFCQITAEEREAMKIKCPSCGRSLIPASYKVHIQMHRKDDVAEPPPDVDTTPGRAKRAAAAKATSLMQEVIKEEIGVEEKKKNQEETADLYQKVGPTRASNPIVSKWRRIIAKEGIASCYFPGCTFKHSDIQILSRHYAVCEKSPRKAFRCDICNLYTKTEKEMKIHLEVEHSTVEDDDTDDEDVEQQVKKCVTPKVYGGKPGHKFLFMGREQISSFNGDKPFSPCVKWTLNFIAENYTEDDIFPEYHSSQANWIEVEEGEYDEYIPQTKESISFSVRNNIPVDDSKTDVKAVQETVNVVWKKMKTFESELINGVPTVFTGGPIWALAWCPLPLRDSLVETRDQFLAVCTHRHMDDTFKSTDRFVGKGLIQIWNFGPLDNLHRPNSSPKLALGIAHEHGVIWDLEWCPSGCFEDSAGDKHIQRLGLLAAACSDGCIHIFSVCFPTSLENNGRYPIFKSKPVISLIMDGDPSSNLGGMPWSCLRLSWYKGKDHRIVAGGFNNGVVALWNLKPESSLLKCHKTNTLLPYYSFQAHLCSITALSLAPQGEGRFFMTGSLDMTVKVWDTENPNRPVPPVLRRGMVTDGVWFTHWLTTLTTYDDVNSMGHTNTTLIPYRGFGYKLFPLLPTNSVAWSLSVTDWINGIAHSTQAGELLTIFPHQLITTEKGMKKKRMLLSFVELRDILNNDVHESEESSSSPCDTTDLTKIKKEVEGKKNEMKKKREKIVFQQEDNKDKELEDGIGFILERNPREGKLCIIKPLGTKLPVSRKRCSIEMDSENLECLSTLNPHEKKLLFSFKSDLERLNVTAKLKIKFPYHDNEKKGSNSNDTVKEYLMVVGAVNDDISEENLKKVRDKKSDNILDSQSQSQSTVLSDDYAAVESKFGVVFCDSPGHDMSASSTSSKTRKRPTDGMNPAPVEMYPIMSLNKVKWNPNCRSFLWLAAGYQCGMLRLSCVSAMHNREVEAILRNVHLEEVPKTFKRSLRNE